VSTQYSLLNGSVDRSETIAVGFNGSPDPLRLDSSPQNGIPDGADRYPAFLNAVLPAEAPTARIFGITRVGTNIIGVVNLLVFQPGTALTLGSSQVFFDSSLGYPIVAVLQNPALPPAPGAFSDNCAPELDDIVLLGTTVDNPCSPTPLNGGNCPGGTDWYSAGYPFFPCEFVNSLDEDADGVVNDGCPQINSISEVGPQCGNNTSDEVTLEDTAINDGCPQIGTSSEASRLPGSCSGSDEGGCTFFANPLNGGMREFTLWTESLRDADSDGIENLLDVCSLIPNGLWNPRAADVVHDQDEDGLPNECDPNPAQDSESFNLCHPAGFVGADEDKDCFPNRNDNCPLANQLENPTQPPGFGNDPTQTDSDRDQIGDACDPSPYQPTGDLASLCLKFPLAVGAPPGPVVRTIDPNLGPACVGTLGLDGDFDEQPDSNDLCPGTPAPATVDDWGCSDAQVDGDGDGLCSPGAPSIGPSGCTGTDACPAAAGTSDGCPTALTPVGGFAGLLNADESSGSARSRDAAKLGLLAVALLAAAAGFALVLRSRQKHL
jgi:hypothetical protein